MESLFSHFAVAAFFLAVINLAFLSHAIESPHYVMILSESDFEIRSYREISWISALVQGTPSFQESTKEGFHRIYQYIHGANFNSSQLPMTAPVVTSITPFTNGSSVYTVSLFLSSNYTGNTPQPNPELSLQIDIWRTRCMAVRQFTGFAEDDNNVKEVEALATSINEHMTASPLVLGNGSSYSIAQYNASYHLSGRLNEVWIDISGFTSAGCLSNPVNLLSSSGD